MSHPLYSATGTPVGRTIEECSELIQALCKAERFGWFNSHPDGQHYSNFMEVRFEIEDLHTALEKLQEYMRTITDD